MPALGLLLPFTVRHQRLSTQRRDSTSLNEGLLGDYMRQIRLPALSYHHHPARRPNMMMAIPTKLTATPIQSDGNGRTLSTSIIQTMATPIYTPPYAA